MCHLCVILNLGSHAPCDSWRFAQAVFQFISLALYIFKAAANVDLVTQALGFHHARENALNKTLGFSLPYLFRLL